MGSRGALRGDSLPNDPGLPQQIQKTHFDGNRDTSDDKPEVHFVIKNRRFLAATFYMVSAHVRPTARPMTCFAGLCPDDDVKKCVLVLM